MKLKRLVRSISMAFALGLAAVSCADRVADPERESGFYSYVDAQGNLVTIQGETERRKEEGGNQESATQPREPSSTSLATGPNQLWSQPDEAYLSTEELDARLEQQERERFVSYPDELGRVTTHAVDMVAAREELENQRAQRADPGAALGGSADAGVAVRDGWETVPVDCCSALLNVAGKISPGDEARVSFSASRSITLDQPRPATGWRLTAGVARLEIQSWNGNGYQWPEVLFLDDTGRPVLMVRNPFTRVLPETWSSEASVRGRVDVPTGSEWVVLFLGYTDINGKKLGLAGNAIRFGESVFPLSYEADTVIRGLSAER